jgi:hypothetical protein
VLNAPPHHLSGWNEDALRVLADRLDLLTEAIEAVPFSFDTIIYWMGRSRQTKRLSSMSMNFGPAIVFSSPSGERWGNPGRRAV